MDMARRMMRWAGVAVGLAAWPAAALAAGNQDIARAIDEAPSGKYMMAYVVAILGAVMLGLAMVRRVRH
jgi:hypothetical protein